MKPPLTISPKDERISGDTLALYLRDSKQLSAARLDPKKQIELAVLYKKTGDVRYRNELAGGILQWVVDIAYRYAKRYDAFAYLPDLIQEGNIGLLYAIEKFDPSYETRVATYATHWIEQKIILFLSQRRSSIRLSNDLVQKISELRKFSRKLEQSLGERSTDEDILEAGFCPKKLRSIRRRAPGYAKILSLEEKLRSHSPRNEDGTLLRDLIPDRSSGGFDGIEAFENTLSRSEIAAYFRRRLKRRNAEILVQYFGLEGEAKTMREVSVSFGLTQQRIQQIIRKLRSNPGVKDFIARALGCPGKSLKEKRSKRDFRNIRKSKRSG